MTIQTLPHKVKTKKKTTTARAKPFRPPVPFNDTYRNGKRDSGGKTVFEIVNERDAKSRRSAGGKVAP